MTTTQRGGTSNVSQPLNSLQIVFKGQMCRLLILHLVCFSWAPMSMSLKVFSFERTQEVTQEVSTHEVSFERTQEVSDPPNSLSFATLDSETIEDLPSRFYWIKIVYSLAKQWNLKSHLCRFILCWSHKQGAWDQRGVFHIYGINHQPWLTVRFCSSWLNL